MISGIAFSDSAANYPYAYNGALYFTDHSRNCIWAMLPGANGLPDPTKVRAFELNAGHPVDLQTGPNGDLFYVDIDDGQVHRITFSPPAIGSCPAGQYDGQYFNNTDLAGAPTVERCEAAVAFNWGTGAPDPAINPNSFSARWSGSFDFSAGKYQFTATAADGIRVLVDGVPLIDRFVDQAATTYTASTALTAGAHQITIEYSTVPAARLPRSVGNLSSAPRLRHRLRPHRPNRSRSRRRAPRRLPTRWSSPGCCVSAATRRSRSCAAWDPCAASARCSSSVALG